MEIVHDDKGITKSETAMVMENAKTRIILSRYDN
jgi:hypothetical protein